MGKKIKNKKKLKWITVFSIVFLITFVILMGNKIYTGQNLKEGDVRNIECVKNSDCLIIRGSCCPCDMGGSPKCIPKTSLTEYTKKLESCSSEGSCMGFDCGQISCGCVNNVCVGRTI